MTDRLLLAIAPSCIASVNRAVYRHLVKKEKINVQLVLPRHSLLEGRVVQCEPVDGEPFICHLLEPQGPPNRLLRFKGLGELIRAIQPTHILNEQGPACFSTFQAVRANRGLRSKIWAITVDNIDRKYLKEAFFSLLEGKFTLATGRLITLGFWWSLRHKIDRVFTLSEESSRLMIKLGFEGKITQMPLGFDPELFYPQNKERIAFTRKRLGLSSKTIAYFGRLVPEKGVEILLKAVSKLKELSWQLLIDNFSLYATPYTDYLRSEVQKLGLDDRVVYFDAVHEEMADYMNACDIVVLPSISTPTFKEQYGRVIPEAMACGKLVIVSRSGALPEVLGDGGYSFAEGNTKELSLLLNHLLMASEKQLDLMREKAIKRANTHLSIMRQAEIWNEILEFR